MFENDARVGSSCSYFGLFCECRHDQVWDPKRANDAHVLDKVHSDVKYNLREAAMVALHELEYNEDKLSGVLSHLKPVDGSDWSQEEKARFHSEIFRLRKNLSEVAKSMNKSVNSCITYYLGSFKKSDDYRLLKTVCAEERAEKLAASEHHGLDSCAICGDGGSLLICDGCEGEYHMACMKPPLAVIPEGHWECDDCVNRKFLKARDSLIRDTDIFERVDHPSKKRKSEDSSTDGNTSDEKRMKSGSDTARSSSTNKGDAGEILLRPTPEVLAAVKKFATSISNALALPKELNTAQAQ